MGKVVEWAVETGRAEGAVETDRIGTGCHIGRGPQPSERLAGSEQDADWSMDGGVERAGENGRTGTGRVQIDWCLDRGSQLSRMPARQEATVAAVVEGRRLGKADMARTGRSGRTGTREARTAEVGMPCFQEVANRTVTAIAVGMVEAL